MAEILGIYAWRAGGHYEDARDEKGNPIEGGGFWVEYIWFAQIFYYQTPFYLSFMKIHEKHEAKQKAIIAVGEKVLHKLDVSNYEDAVIASLESVNLACRTYPDHIAGNYITLNISTRALEAQIFMPLFSHDESIRQLQDSVLKTLNELVVRYQDASLEKLLVPKSYD